MYTRCTSRIHPVSSPDYIYLHILVPGEVRGLDPIPLEVNLYVLRLVDHQQDLIIILDNT